MKKFEITTEVQVFDTADELAADDKLLLQKAKEAMLQAYAPYSRYHVGAALKLENGIIVVGNNQENVAYPSGMCAERVAFFAASANYPNVKPVSIAVISYSKDFTVDKPVTPCGACRQVMAEYENLFQQPIKVILAGEKGPIYILKDVHSLMPLSFSASELKIK